jgi:hypothetical protein
MLDHLPEAAEDCPNRKQTHTTEHIAFWLMFSQCFMILLRSCMMIFNQEINNVELHQRKNGLRITNDLSGDGSV